MYSFDTIDVTLSSDMTDDSVCNSVQKPMYSAEICDAVREMSCAIAQLESLNEPSHRLKSKSYPDR